MDLLNLLIPFGKIRSFLIVGPNCKRAPRPGDHGASPEIRGNAAKQLQLGAYYGTAAPSMVLAFGRGPTKFVE